MANQKICIWNGKSGAKYKYHIHTLPVDFNANQDGNYIFSKYNKNKKWVPIYIGQGDLKDRTENHHKIKCISNKGATHVHVHLNPNKKDRLFEEEDLLKNYQNAYQPIGCNEREGG